MYSTARLVAQDLKLPTLPHAGGHGCLPPSSCPSASKPPSRAKTRGQTPNIATQVPPNVREVTQEALQSLQKNRGKKQSRKRTTTWPSERYHLWLGVSNLPVAPLRTESSAPGWRESRSGSLLLPPVGPGSVAEEQPPGARRRPGFQARDMQTKSSPAHPTSTLNSPQQHGHGAVYIAPRLPSRMGRNSLEHYEKMCAYSLDRDVQKFLNQQTTPSVYCQLLEVRSETRHPMRRRLTTCQDQKGEGGGRVWKDQQLTSTHGRTTTLSDVPPPASTPCLQPAYTITSYMT